MDYFKEGYIKLNNAIWGQAVVDELQEQKTRLLCETTESLFNALLKYEKDERNTFAKVSKIITLEYGSAALVILTKLETEFEIKIKSLTKSVKNKIYRESQKWPNNVKNKKDSVFEKEFAQIRDSVLRAFNTKEAING